MMNNIPWLAKGLLPSNLMCSRVVLTWSVNENFLRNLIVLLFPVFLAVLVK